MNRLISSITVLIVALIAVSAAADIIEQHDFGSSNVHFFMYDTTVSADFESQNSMQVLELEVKSVIQNSWISISGLPPIVQPSTITILVNGTEVDSWTFSSMASIISASTDLRKKKIDFYIASGDTITYSVKGGSTPDCFNCWGECFISGPNYVKLTGSNGISVEPALFTYGGDCFNVLDSNDIPDGKCLTYDGTFLWTTNNDDTVSKLNEVGNVIDSFSTPDTGLYGIAFDGTYFWTSDYNSDMIYQLDTFGSIVSSFSSPGTDPLGLLFDGMYLWNVDGDSDMIYKMNTSGSVLLSFSAPDSGTLDFAYDGTYLWCTGNATDKIYKLNKSGVVLGTFNPPATNPLGLTYDGSHFWHTDFGTDMIYKLRPPGYVMAGSSETITFTVYNHGAGDLSIGTITISGSNGSEFEINNDNCSGQTIAPSAKATFDCVFSPLAAGERNAVVHIPSDDASNPLLEVPLTGLAEKKITPGLIPAIQMLLLD